MHLTYWISPRPRVPSGIPAGEMIIMGKPASSHSHRDSGLMRRPVGALGLGVMILAIATAPAILFFDPVSFWPGAHTSREATGIYRLWSDDVAYISGSHTWARTMSNLFVPHNTHIVPAWRILTWALVAMGGHSSSDLPDVLAIASYSILVAVMLLAGRLIARETGRTHWPGGDGPGGHHFAHGDSRHLVLGGPAPLGQRWNSGHSLVRTVLSAIGPMAGSGTGGIDRSAGRLVLDGGIPGRAGSSRLSVGRRQTPVPSSRGGAGRLHGRAVLFTVILDARHLIAR